MPLLEKFEALSYRLFGRFTPYFLKNVFHIKGSLDKGRVKIYPETYISMMFFIAMLTLPVSVLGIVIVLLYSIFTSAYFGTASAFCSRWILSCSQLITPATEQQTWSVKYLLRQHTLASWHPAALHRTLASSGYQK